MWFGSSFACKWGLCVNTWYVNVFLQRPQPRVCLCCVWNKDHHQEGWELFTSSKNTPPSHAPPCLLSSDRSWFSPTSCFLPASLRRDPLLLLWLCVSGYLAKEAARWSCVRGQKGGRCFLTLLRLTWSVWGKHKRLACARSQTSQPLACFSLSLLSSSATAFRLQGLLSFILAKGEHAAHKYFNDSVFKSSQSSRGFYSRSS